MITVFGSINMDLIATTERLPKPGETVSGGSFTSAAGGKGANQALAARRAGSTVRMAAATGDDAFAATALAFLMQAGVDLSSVKSAPGATGTAVILVGGDGENMIAVIPGANGEVTVADATAAVQALGRKDYLMMQLEVPPAAVETALRAAKARGISTVLNLAPLIPEAAALGALADIVICNETEFERLAGRDGMSADERLAALKALHAQTSQTLIVTLGADGVIAMRNGAFHSARGLAIDPVDTVGAGDTFCGYLVSGLDQGLAFDTALVRAAAAGSLACLKPGAQPSIPLATEVEAALAG